MPPLWRHAADEMLGMYQSLHCDFEALPRKVQREIVFVNSADNVLRFIDHIYRHFDAFKLIITCSEGTEYAGFIDQLVDIEVRSTLKFIKATDNPALLSGKITPALIHIVSNAFFLGYI